MADEKLAAAYRDVFGHPNAERVLEDLFLDAGLFAENSYAAAHQNQNPAAIGVFEGKRRLALRIACMTLGGSQAAAKALAKAVMAQRAAPPALAKPRAALTENSSSESLQ